MSKVSVLSVVFGTCAGHPTECRVVIREDDDPDLYDNSIELVRAVLEHNYPDCFVNVREYEDGVYDIRQRDTDTQVPQEES
jgi:hypothetical protein